MNSEELMDFGNAAFCRWPFLRRNLEIEKTIFAIFGHFRFEPAMDAIAAYAVSDPDLNVRTFKWNALKGFCESLSGNQQQFYWSPADESQLWIEKAHCERHGLPEPIVLTFAIHTLGKSRAPTLSERQSASERLRGLGAKMTSQIAAQQEEDHRAYDQWLRNSNDPDMITRQRGQCREKGNLFEEFRERARAFIQRRATTYQENENDS